MGLRNGQSRLARIGATAAVMLAVFALTLMAVGAGYAKSTASAAQIYYGGKVTICHVAGPHGKTVTITVAAAAVPAHMRHGDETGACA